MPLRSSLNVALLLVGLGASGTALAQTAECQRHRAELASLGRSANVGAALQQNRHEIARLGAYYQSIGCGGDHFFLFGGPPPECGAIAQRISTMQANHARLASSANHGNESRRRQLTAAIKQACNPSQREAAAEEASPRGLGGGRLVCVRACDGYFFPLTNLPASGRSDADDMCKALCPGAEAAAYSMPSGADAEIAQAVSLRGKRYTKLAGAFKFQKAFDASCSCRKEGQSWAEALQKAEKMIERGRGDIIVTAKKAEELSRPKLVRKGKPSKAAEPQIAAKPLDVETTGSIAPKAGGEPEPQAEKVAANSTDEQKPDSAGAIAKRAIRIVGPAFISPAAAAPAE